MRRAHVAALFVAALASAQLVARMTGEPVAHAMTGGLRSTGSTSYNVTYQAASYTANAYDVVDADATSGSITITAPANGNLFLVSKWDTTSNAVIIVPNAGVSGSTIAGGLTTYSLTVANQSVSWYYDATKRDWRPF